jgi:hypothetical protein
MKAEVTKFSDKFMQKENPCEISSAQIFVAV